MQNNDTEFKIKCLKKFGKNPLSFLTISEDFSLFRSNWEGYIAYKNSFKTAIVLGNPIVPDDSLNSALHDLKKWSKQKGIHICFFACSNHKKDIFLKEGFKCIYIGKEAVVDLNKFTISGNKNWKIRSSINYAKKNEMHVIEYKLDNERSENIEKNIRMISDDWRKMKKIPEPSFGIGKIDFRNDGSRYFICLQKEKTIGYINYYPIYGQNCYYLDHTRRSINSPRGTMDLLIVKSFEKLKSEGINKVYIGLSPFSFPSDFSIKSPLKLSLFNILRQIFEIFYPMKSEFFFKDKYATEWEPNYFFYYPHLSMRMIISFVQSFYEGGLGALILKKIF